MAKKKSAKKQKLSWRARQTQRLRRWGLRTAIWAVSLFIFAVLIFTVINPPTTYTMLSEKRRLGAIDQDWVPMEAIAPVMARAVVAAEDANFCDHWGFDVKAIRAAIEAGGARGASTISQQTVKNVYLWQGRSWLRKALEASITPVVELAWSKRRILEIYLNIAEFDEGVFGVEAAAQHYFGVPPDRLSARQAARLASVLPAPKQRSASRPTTSQVRRIAAIMDGAATIDRDGRARCFQ
ncbi:monofunctional biosynthetic peptidoglycan transglycosylase [Cognatishimia sp. SS12]|uniref:monofunctional biosynthetic peptidoglycan transglycosylase n=1 Tax=Cognatishimia sp. SS12 TaxID=2979465 RepID=UPI00232C5AD4|nr:monofunctional biosynthetic peptidoglycan transglycosylase [Cognatishimia sp. SS12]MDC0737802.1 monofunctional biosynthetic peptidoglycan transglycosylase [Cognatishimia sp. SS12]